jgi:hypothetical protein
MLTIKTEYIKSTSFNMMIFTIINITFYFDKLYGIFGYIVLATILMTNLAKARIITVKFIARAKYIQPILSLCKIVGFLSFFLIFFSFLYIK